MIKIINNKDDISKKTLIEIQGEILHTSEDTYENMNLGDLIENKEKGTFSFYIGNHILEGKRIKLKNPLLLFKKERKTEEDVEKEVFLTEIFYEKIVFQSRPMPVSSEEKIFKEK